MHLTLPCRRLHFCGLDLSVDALPTEQVMQRPARPQTVTDKHAAAIAVSLTQT
jgi:hypothetical protein